MPIVKSKPTSAGRRFAVRVVSPDLHKGEPYAPLVEKQAKTGGRNNTGRIIKSNASFHRESGPSDRISQRTQDQIDPTWLTK